MLRYDIQTKPGLVALYDIRPGNGAGPFLQPGACMGQYELSQDVIYPSLLSTSEGSIMSLSVSTIDKRLEVFEIWIWRHMMKV